MCDSVIDDSTNFLGPFFSGGDFVVARLFSGMSGPNCTKRDSIADHRRSGPWVCFRLAAAWSSGNDVEHINE